MEPALLTALAAALLAFGAVSRKAERSVLTPPLFFVLCGYALSERGLGWLDFAVDERVIHGLAELTLVLVLFTDASRIDLACLRREGSLPARMLGIGFPLTLAAGALAAAALFPELAFLEAALLAALLTPTDAALGQSVVSSPELPVRIRQSLNVESGLNDGLALPVVLLTASLAGAAGDGGGVAGWLRFAGLQVTMGPLVGLAVGYAGGKLVQKAAASGWMNAPFQRLSALGLAVLAFAGAELAGGNGFLAAFVAGLTMGNAARAICQRLYDFGEAEGQLLTLLVFVIFGGVMLPGAFAGAGGLGLLYALLSLTVLRMLPVVLSLLGAGLRPATLAFLGWFGPRGLASILFLLLVVEEESLAAGALLESVVVVTVFLSTLAHGVTATPLARRYAAHLAAGDPGIEHEPAMELPVRVRMGVELR